MNRASKIQLHGGEHSLQQNFTLTALSSNNCMLAGSELLVMGMCIEHMVNSLKLLVHFNLKVSVIFGKSVISQPFLKNSLAGDYACSGVLASC